MSPSHTSTEVDSTYNVVPMDYQGHLALARAHDLVLWENHGWGVRSLGGDGDTLLWVAAYQLRSRGPKPFVKPEFSALQSMVTHVEYTSRERSRMNDNDFSAIGWNGMEDLRPPEDLSIDVASDRTVWAIDDMRFTAAPPEWRVEGCHQELDYDLRLKAESPAFWLTDPKLTALEHGDRWHLVNARASGRVIVEGRPIALNGMGWHERHIHLNDYYDPTRLLRGPGVVFHNGYSAELNFHMMGRPKLGIFRAKILCEGEEIDFAGPEQITAAEADHWVDPRSRLYAPVRWNVRCASEAGTLSLEVRAFARTYYLWNFLSGGVNVLYWWLAESSGRFERPGRSPLVLENMKHVVHQNQAFYHYPERMPDS